MPSDAPEPASLPLCLSPASSDCEERAPRWTLSEESYGLLVDPKHDRSSRASGAEVVRFEHGTVEVVVATPGRSDREFPVYRLEDGPALAVATGRLFVRLSEGNSARERVPDFAKLGLSTEDVPTYAPHCAWLAPMSGRAVDGLSALDSLAALPDVERVEPQLLRVSHRRGSSKRR